MDGKSPDNKARELAEAYAPQFRWVGMGDWKQEIECHCWEEQREAFLAGFAAGQAELESVRKGFREYRVEMAAYCKDQALAHDALEAELAEARVERDELAAALRENGAAQAIDECVKANDQLKAEVERLRGLARVENIQQLTHDLRAERAAAQGLVDALERVIHERMCGHAVNIELVARAAIVAYTARKAGR